MCRVLPARTGFTVCTVLYESRGGESKLIDGTRMWKARFACGLQLDAMEERQHGFAEDWPATRRW